MKTTKKAAEVENFGKAVIVTTEHRGVFFGYLQSGTITTREVTLKDARCVVSWPAAQRGFMGLAAIGPVSGAKISPAAKSMDVNKVTAILICADGVAEKYEAAPWG